MKRFLFNCTTSTPRLTWVLFLLVSAFLLTGSRSAFAVFEKSSKKGCAICHVMWLDEFRSNQETLIKWQPGNVLMKNTQGVVSSEAMCYSCHDGYVVDSRYSAWKYHNHPTFVKPPKNMKIPKAFPLSNKNEIYCGTCHSPHSGETPMPGEIPAQFKPGPLFFLRAPNVDSEMCEQCHVGEADYKRTHSHPVHTDRLKIPETLFEHGSVRAEKKNTVICQTCHEVHGAKGSHLTVMDNSKSQLCITCHKERTLIGTPHDFDLTMADETNIKGESVEKSGPCSACHVPHNAVGDNLWARKPVTGNSASQICLSCHTGKPGSKIKGIGRYSHPLDVSALSKADQRVAGPLLTDRLPLFSKNGKQEPGGTVQCFTCHNIHQWNPDDPAARGGKDAKGSAADSFLRISAAGTSALCVTCHTDKKQVLAHDHNLVRTAPAAKNIRGETAAVSGPCGACHLPHNAGDKRLWARQGAQTAGSSPRYCTGCHSETGAASKKPVGKNDHPVDVVLKGAGIPSASQVRVSLPLYTAAGGTKGGNIIRCRTCHDPHIWSPAGEGGTAAVESASGAPAATTGNQEGDARNSFLRMEASPHPNLCLVCHGGTGLLVGTDHDLSVTAPTAKNLLGQTVAQSGPCGVCHAMHNSPEKRLLWAQRLGPVEKGQHPMDALCTGCHSKGGVAADKIPAVATHPSGMLINNIFTASAPSGGYIKLFDRKDWKETRVGDLCCSSCHSFYQWDHRVKKRGPGIKVEGNVNTSFLRTSSDRVVCIDCHGQTAIWRYTYFHSVQKRKMIKGLRPQ